MKVALITGANSGIGRITAETLAAQGWQVYLACRSERKSRPVIDGINQEAGETRAHYLPLDLGDLDSVRECARRFLATGLPLQLLINNAGLAGNRGITASGFEMTFGVCHVGHFLLTQLLLEKLKASAPARVVTVSSQMHLMARGINFDALRKRTSLTGLPEYGVAKLANLLFSKELARRVESSGVTTYALHPGAVATDVWRALPGPIAWIAKRFMLTEEQGAATTLYCATDPAVAGESGLYYENCKRHKNSAVGDDAALAQRLWNESERWVAA